MYKLPGEGLGGILRDDGATIPNDQLNKDWQQYQLWLASDPANVPAPADPSEPYVPL